MQRDALARAHLLSSAAPQPYIALAMPGFMDPFWILRGNRLRVWGTEEKFMEAKRLAGRDGD